MREIGYLSWQGCLPGDKRDKGDNMGIVLYSNKNW